jgi:hypothetical protein
VVTEYDEHRLANGEIDDLVEKGQLTNIAPYRDHIVTMHRLLQPGHRFRVVVNIDDEPDCD